MLSCTVVILASQFSLVESNALFCWELQLFHLGIPHRKGMLLLVAAWRAWQLWSILYTFWSHRSPQHVTPPWWLVPRPCYDGRDHRTYSWYVCRYVCIYRMMIYVVVISSQNPNSRLVQSHSFKPVRPWCIRGNARHCRKRKRQRTPAVDAVSWGSCGLRA